MEPYYRRGKIIGIISANPLHKALGPKSKHHFWFIKHIADDIKLMNGLLHDLSAGQGLLLPPWSLRHTAYPNTINECHLIILYKLDIWLYQIAVATLESGCCDQACLFDLITDLSGQFQIQGQRLFHKKRNPPSYGLHLNIPMAGRRNADKDHVGLNRIIHLSEICKCLPAVCLFHKTFRPLGNQITKSCQFNVRKPEEMTEMISADSSTTDDRQFFHFVSSCFCLRCCPGLLIPVPFLSPNCFSKMDRCKSIHMIQKREK